MFSIKRQNRGSLLIEFTKNDLLLMNEEETKLELANLAKIFKESINIFLKSKEKGVELECKLKINWKD